MGAAFQRLKTCHVLVAAIVLAFVLLPACMQPSSAYAETAIGSVTYCDDLGKEHIYTYNSISDLLKHAKSDGGKVVIDLFCDWDTSDIQIVIPEGRNYTLNLHGYVIDRGKAGTSWYGSGSGEVIHVEKGATLTINGGTEQNEHAGTFLDYKRFWQLDPKGKDVIKGGLITGGACDDWHGAGGISAEGTNTKIYLNDVTIAGNVADEYGLFSRYGNGGGVALHGSDSTLEMDNSKIEYNHAEGLAGGLYLRNSGCKVTLKDGSSISHNYSKDDGGGIFVDGSNTAISLESKSEVSNNETSEEGGGIYQNGTGGSVRLSGESKIDSNNSKKNGGGIYDYYNDTEFVLDNSSIARNDAGFKYSGGGIYLNDVATVTLKNGSKIKENAAYNGAGIFVDDDGTKISLEGSSAIDSNYASYAGGGVYSNDDFDMTLDASKISNNTGQYGAGVFVLNDTYTECYYCNVYLKNNASICNNGRMTRGEDESEAATISGGGISFWGRGKYVVASEDKTGTISGNSAGRGGGILLGLATSESSRKVQSAPEMRLEGITITGGTATWGSALYTLGRTDLIDCTIEKNVGQGAVSNLGASTDSPIGCGGKVIIANNSNSRGGASNFLFHSKQRLTTARDSSGNTCLLSADSKISVNNLEGMTDDGLQITDSAEVVTNFKDKVEDVITTDAEDYVVGYKEGKDYLYLQIGYKLTIYDSAGKQAVTPKLSGTTITLKSSDYVKAGTVGGKDTQFVLDYWEVTGLDGTARLDAADDEASFTMPSNNVVLRPHYKSVFSGLSIGFAEELDWDELTQDCADPKHDAATSLVLYDADGSQKSCGSEAAAKYVDVRGRTIEDTTDASGAVVGKKLTYTLKFSSALLSSLGWTLSDESLKLSTLKVGAPFGNQETSDVTVGLEEDSSGNRVYSLTASFDFTIDSKSLVTVSGYDVNDAEKQQVASDVYAVDSAGTVTLAPMDVNGMQFFAWDESTLPEGATVTDDGTLTFEGTGSALQLSASYEPLVTSCALELSALELDGSFPSTVTSYKVTDSSERDVTKAANSGISIAWTKGDGTAVSSDDVVEGGTVYKAAITTKITDSDSYHFAFSPFVSATVNGVEADSVTIDEAAGTQTVVYTATTDPDQRYGSLLTDLFDEEIVASSAYTSYLPKMAHYRLKNGEVKTSPFEWDGVADVDSITSGSFVVGGSFDDEDGETHEVTRTFTISEDLGSLQVDKASGTYSSAQTVTVSSPVTWDEVEDAAIYYCLVTAASGVDPSTVERSQYTELEGDTLTISESATLLLYAKVGNRETETLQRDYSIKALSSISVGSGKAYDQSHHEITECYEGETVYVEADDPEDGMAFGGWNVTAGGVALEDSSKPFASFVMPAENVSLEASYYNAQLTVSFGGTDSLVYDGKAHSVTAALDGAVEGDDVSVDVSYEDAEGKALEGAPTDAGSYVAKASLVGDDAGKYELTGETSIEFAIAPVDIASTEITAPEAQIYTGKAIEAAPRVSFGECELSSGADYDLSWTDNIDAGTATVTIAGKGNFSGSTTTAFEIERADAGISVKDVPGKTYGDEAFSLEASAKTNAELGYSSDDESVVKVSDEGKVTIVGVGKVTINVSAAETKNYSAGKASVGITIEPKPLTVSFDGVDGLVYDGKPHVVTAALHGAMEGDDVFVGVSYEDAEGKALEGAPTDAGSYVAKASLSGDDVGKYELSGSASVTFDVSTAGFAGSKITLSKASLTYSGKSQKPSVKSVKFGSKTLKAGIDYTASVATGKKIGTYKVTVTGKGSYRGTASTSYEIVPKGVTKFKVKAKGKKKFKATWKKSKTNRSGVQLRYSLKKNMTNAKTAKAKGASVKAKTVKKLKRHKRYYVQARVYKVVGGKTYYSAWSSKKSVKVK